MGECLHMMVFCICGGVVRVISPRKANPREAKSYAALVAMKRPRVRPKAVETKVFTAIRLDAYLLEIFKAIGKGWQTRVNAALRRFIAEHPLGR